MKRVLATCVFGALLLVGLYPIHVLEIQAAREDRTVFVRPVRPGLRFALGFTHSVENCPVQDYLQIDAHYRMVLYKTAFWSSRTGLPYAAFGDEVFAVEGDHFTISNMQRVIPGLHQWVAKRYQNTMTFGDARGIDLAALAGDTLLFIDIKRLRLWRYVITRLDLILN